ncbi:GDSL-type esterase/lipase family protein [Pseudalkalibacillus hwajinpoensis]|uniref:G-D-S-L family lipolytic protein n=1 Tax=Guptibacillus hwajinpoensis TaxID=208199 RepID=A0A4U1MID0_9BACL|nr:GDSL-type esterase/lipase family protein [Pseudalkalibacillus hwajinpoensis]TKD70212.1 G-D-S-L family lipolytic protein [Pseudalkalibacillus hwajinpoensis]
MKRRIWILVLMVGSLAILLALAENQSDFLRTNANEMPENDSESKKKNITYYTKYYQTKKSIYDSYTHQDSETIFLGDSLTDYYEWGEALSDYKVLNRGIAGDTTTGVLNRIDEVIAAKPDRVYLLVGINDMIAGQSVNKIETNYKQILDTLKTNSPNTEVYVQSLFPVNTALTGHPINNNVIKEMNERLKDLASLYNYQYIDIHKELVEFGQLNKNYTFDGLHLNGEGYKIWTRVILSTYNTNEKVKS